MKSSVFSHLQINCESHYFVEVVIVTINLVERKEKSWTFKTLLVR